MTCHRWNTVVRSLLSALITVVVVTLVCIPARTLPGERVGGTLIFVPYDTVFGNPSIRRKDIQSIRFLSDLSGKPDGAWDVSANRNGTVWAWLTPADEKLYDLSIASDGIIMLDAYSFLLFSGYANLTAIHFNGNVDTSSVVDMSSMFDGCEKLTKLDVSCFDTGNVTRMSNMFSRCGGLFKLDVSHFDTSSVTDMSWMFFQCGGLSELDLSGFNTSNVADMRGIFSNCENLTELDVSGFNTANATDMSAMFSDCKSLNALIISSDFVIAEGSDIIFLNCPIQSLDDCTVVN